MPALITGLRLPTIKPMATRLTTTAASQLKFGYQSSTIGCLQELCGIDLRHWKFDAVCDSDAKRRL